MGAARDESRAVFRDLMPEFLALDDVHAASMFGSEALKVCGKVAAFVGGDGELIVKLPADRAGDLVATGAASRVRIGRNDAREWVALPAGHEDGWRAFVEDAVEFVGSLHRKVRR